MPVNWQNVRKLRDFVEQDPGIRFHQGTSISCGPDHDLSDREQLALQRAAKNTCGAAACLMGCAAILATKEGIAPANVIGASLEWLFGRPVRDYFRTCYGDRPADVSKDILTFNHIWTGSWSENGLEATREEAITYLNKAIAENNLLVSLAEGDEE